MQLQKKTIAILIICGTILFLSIPLVAKWIVSAENTEPYMFTDIGDFEKLEPFVTKELAEPKRLSNLNPVGSYCREVNYHGKTFRVYAYEFATAADAQTYCDQFVHFNFSMGISQKHSPFSFRYVALYDKFIYRVERNHITGNGEFVRWLAEDFEINISELIWDEVFRNS